MVKRTAPVANPDISDLGPAMLALSEQQRRFVIAYVGDSRDISRCALAAGYSTSSNGHRVAAHRMMRAPKIIAAIKEEADKRLNSAAYIAVSGLSDIAADPEHRDRQKACDSILDRTGYPRREVRAVVPDDEGEYRNKSTAELLEMIRSYALSNCPDLCVRDSGSNRVFVDIEKAQERLKARVVAELVSRRQQPALEHSGANDNAAD